MLRAVNRKDRKGAQRLRRSALSSLHKDLSTAAIPSCLKSAIIIPLPKKMTTVQLHLPKIIIKCFERLVQEYIKASLTDAFDPHQFTYITNSSTEDAIATALHIALLHLEHPGSYVRMLFINYSSVFNTVLSDRLVAKMLVLGLSPSICHWIKEFLTNRPQTLRIGSHISSTLTLCSGAPQGCVLRPLLYVLHTNDCTPSILPTLSSISHITRP